MILTHNTSSSNPVYDALSQSIPDEPGSNESYEPGAFTNSRTSKTSTRTTRTITIQTKNSRKALLLCLSITTVLSIIIFVLITFLPIDMNITSHATRANNNNTTTINTTAHDEHHKESESLSLSTNVNHTNANTTFTNTNTNSTIQKTNNHNSSPISYGTPFIIVTEGGCSGTTSIGSYIRSIIKAHGLQHLPRVTFEFLNAHKKNPRTNKYKNIYFQQIINERNISIEQAKDNIDIILQSIQRAQIDAIKSESFMFFKASAPQYNLLYQNLTNYLMNVSYAGVYRKNVLDRCICMVRDCFQEAQGYGNAVVALNENTTTDGTGGETIEITDLCFNRRKHPDVNVQANFTNVTGCIMEDQGRVDYLKLQRNVFDSFSSESLFQFEESMNEDVFQNSIIQWMNFLRPMMGHALHREIVASVLQKDRGVRSESSSQESKVYNYDQVKEELNKVTKWKELLHV